MHTPHTLRAWRASLCLICLFLLAFAGCSSVPRTHTRAQVASRGAKPAALAVPAAVTTAAPAKVTKAAAAPASATQTASVTAEPPLPQPGVLLDRVVAVVDDDVILKSELDAHTQEVLKQIQAQNTPLPPLDVLQKQVLDQMITARIELEQAANRGITVSDDTVNQALSNIATRAGVTLNQLPDSLKKQGIDYAAFRRDLRDQIIIQNLEQQVLSDELHITQQELDDQMHADQLNGNSGNEYHLSQILVALPLNPSPEQVAAARKKADDIYQKLKGGADFAATAVALSDDQQALKGGDLGWRKGAELPTVFASVVPQMKAGDFSTPIQSIIGFHIVKLNEVKQGQSTAMVTQTHARHILLRTGATMTEAQAKAKIQALYQQIKAGADFAKLAEENSADPGSAKQGGDLGWVDPGATVPEFDAAMAKLQPGEVSAPFQTQFGWHIVQVLGRRQAEQTDESRKNAAYQAIYNRKSEDVIQHWLGQMKDAAFIEYHLDQ
ncbi:MAG TPA: peptidylprolyl isomerase [Gammaproteobacteria bacterium]|jgi:peptidyl-prolyl cis-trans isomerase SurA|nr:peptidylprolyl isomerase [Gammaproteobacteria bacterium]